MLAYFGLYQNNFCRTLFPISSLLLLFLSTTSVATPARFSLDKTLISGANNNFAPFEFLNEKGVPDGFTIDLMKAVAKKEDLKIKFIPDTWHNIRRGLEEQKFDAVTGMLYSKERDKIFDFSVPHFVISYAVFIRKETPIKSLADINGKEVIVVEDVYAHDWMMEKKITNSIIPVSEPIEDIQSDALVMADATQIHQIVMNLCTNARQAMLDAGGILRLRLSEVQLDEDQIGPEAAFRDILESDIRFFPKPVRNHRNDDWPGYRLFSNP